MNNHEKVADNQAAACSRAELCDDTGNAACYSFVDHG
jgi:hypothetical protein